MFVFLLCKECSNIKCKSCSSLNSSICLSCIENHIVSPTGDCMCPSNTSDMEYLPKCYDIKDTNCHYSCLKCIGEKSDQCISCDETKDFVNYTCVCKKGYYEEFSSKQCKSKIYKLHLHSNVSFRMLENLQLLQWVDAK